MNNENDIVVTASDYADLSSVITLTGKVSQRVKWELRLLENELKRARIVAPEESTIASAVSVAVQSKSADPEPFHGSFFVAGLNDVEGRSCRFSEPGDPPSFKSRGSLRIAIRYIA